MHGDSEQTDRIEDSSSGLRRRRLVLRGVLPGDNAVCPIDAPRVKVGRAEDCDLRIDGCRVSRYHIEIYRQGPLYALRDLGSTNGTWVDGLPAPHSPVRPGALLRLGNWLGLFQELDAGPLAPFRELTPGLFGGSELASALNPLARVAPTDLPVVLLGATGTGKECFARALHALSGRTGPFHAINCAALSPGLAEGELFGYQKGAFTGAVQAQVGHLRAAHGGTLFLDEVADLPLALQPKLLRVLEQQEVTPLGATRALGFDARLVVACQSPLEAEVASGRFRDDLANRLAGLVVQIPSLCERRADIPSLFQRFISERTGGRPPELSVKLLESLCLNSWPGNVRELSLLARQMLALQGLEPRLRRSHLPAHLRHDRAERDPAEASAGSGATRRDYDRKRLEAALKECDGQVKVAAAKVGISRQRAYRLISGAEMGALAELSDGGGTDAGAD